MTKSGMAVNKAWAQWAVDPTGENRAAIQKAETAWAKEARDAAARRMKMSQEKSFVGRKSLESCAACAANGRTGSFPPIISPPSLCCSPRLR
jgi:hypothetical protein